MELTAMLGAHVVSARDGLRQMDEGKVVDSARARTAADSRRVAATSACSRQESEPTARNPTVGMRVCATISVAK